MMNNPELEASKQALSLDYLLDREFFPNAEELCLFTDFSVISSFSSGKRSIIQVHSVMYPTDMNQHNTQKCIDEISLVCRRANIVPEECDFYFIGVGLSQKGVQEAEKGVYVIGKKYLVFPGFLYLLKKRAGEQHGYDQLSPIGLSSVPNEYFYIQNMKAKSGEIVDKSRIGSIGGENHILDKWRITVKKPNGILVVSDIYLDPYYFDLPPYCSDESEKVSFVLTDVSDSLHECEEGINESY